MLIDGYLPSYDVSERHEVVVRASLDRVYASVQKLDLTKSRLARLLFRLRGIRIGSSYGVDQLIKLGFVLLAADPGRELVLGLVGRFWTLSGKLRRLDRDGFLSFAEPGYAKAAWNFSLSQIDASKVLLVTETRIYCADRGSRRRFRLYWILIGSFSKLIRREMLRIIKNESEQPD